MQMFGLARLGRDAELRRTTNGDSVATLALAFSYGRKGEDGYRQTQWVDGAMWGKRAEALAEYLVKGGLVAVTLEDVHIETYEGAKGQGHKLVGRVTEIELAGGGQRAEAPRAAAPVSSPAARPAPAKGGSGFDDMHDDVPFAPLGKGRLCLAM